MISYDQSNTLEKLVDSTTLLEVKLAKELDKTSQRWLTTNDAGNILQVNKAATLRVIEKLNRDIYDLGEDGIELTVSKGKGIQFNIRNDKDIQVLIAYIVSKEPAVQLLEAIFKEEIYSVTQYAQQNYVSEATVRRNINKIRSYFDDFDVTISRVTAKLEGDEKQIRLLMMIFYWRVYGGVTWPFDSIAEQELSEMSKRLLYSVIRSDIEIPHLFIRQISYYFAEAVLRTRKKNFVNDKEKKICEVAQGYRYERFKEILEKECIGKINILDEEIAFHYTVGLSMSAPYHMLISSTIDDIIEDHRKRNTLIFQAVELSMEKINSYFFTKSEINLDTSLTRYSLFSCHCFAYVFKNFKSDMNGLVYNNYFQNNYPTLSMKVHDFLKELYELSSNEIFLEQRYLLLPYIKIITQDIEPVYFEKKIYVILESDMPILITTHVIKKIEFYFKKKYHIKFLEFPKKKIAESVDVVITTATTKNLNNQYPNAKIIKINREPTPKDFRELTAIFETLKKK